MIEGMYVSQKSLLHVLFCVRAKIVLVSLTCCPTLENTTFSPQPAYGHTLSEPQRYSIFEAAVRKNRGGGGKCTCQLFSSVPSSLVLQKGYCGNPDNGKEPQKTICKASFKNNIYCHVKAGILTILSNIKGCTTWHKTFSVSSTNKHLEAQ
jgi:hypothetical protein